jgi:hypothetical protein
VSERRDQARAILWQQGIVAPWFLRKSQLDVYRLLLNEKRPFVEASRRFGKTTSLICFVFEQLNSNPGWVCRWCEPQKDQARKIVMPIIDFLQSHVPRELHAQYFTTDSVYRFPNGSQFFLLGVNEDKGESARGPAANIIVLDEYGFWTHAKYVAKSILFPQLQAQEGQWFIKASTPPPDLGHVYYEEKQESVGKGRFIQKLIWDNEALTEQELSEIIEEAGGVESPTFRREYLCEAISNPDMLVCPEWVDTLNTVPNDYPRPEFFTPYVGGDSGADDNTALLFGYYDFQQNEVVIEDEIVVSGQTTKVIIDQAKAKERELWGDRQPSKRWYDAPKQLIYDMFTEYKYPVTMPEKSDRTAWIHRLRTEVGSRKFKVKTKCQNLRTQMAIGMWKDERHSDFQRSENLGHLDALISAVYFNRAIDRKLNPVPANHGLSKYTHFITPQASGTNTEALRRAFKFRGR